MAYSLVKRTIKLKDGKTVQEFYYFDGIAGEVEGPQNLEAIKREAGLIFDLRLLDQATSKYNSKLLPDRKTIVAGLYDDMAKQVLKFMNRIIWEVPPTNKTAGGNFGKYADDEGVLTGEPLSRAFELGMKMGADLKKYDEYVLELHFPTSILQKGLQWEKRNYLEDINKTKDLASFEKSSKKKK